MNLSGQEWRPERVPKAAGVQGPDRLDMSGSLVPASNPAGPFFRAANGAHFDVGTVSECAKRK